MNTVKWFERDRTLLRDERRWGRGYGGKNFTPEELDETAASIAAARASGQVPEGYGPRMTANNPGFRIKDSTILLPSGFDARTPGTGQGLSQYQRDSDKPTTSPNDENFWLMPEVLQDLFRREGYALDQNGRPCNPHGVQLVTDPRIGLNTNLGGAPFCGESVTVDTVITDGEKVMLTTSSRRGETMPCMISDRCNPNDFGVQVREWAAGQRRITHQGLLKATRRIAALRTGLTLPERTTLRIAWGYRPTGVLQTWHAWTVNYTVLVRIPDGFSQYMSPSLILGRPEAAWHDLSTIALIVDSFELDDQRAFKAAMKSME